MEEGQSQQALHTERLIEEMLEFLNSSSEVEDDEEEKERDENEDEELAEHLEGRNTTASPLPASRVKIHKSKFRKTLNTIEEDVTDAEEHSEDEYFREPLLYKDQHLHWLYGKDIKGLKQQYHSKWNSKDINVENEGMLPSDATANISTSLTLPIWQTFTKTNSLGGSIENDTIEIGGDWFKWQLNIRQNNSIAYIQEVQRAIYGNQIGFPRCGSENYFKAAENYAAHGIDFLDFPLNLLSLWCDTDTSSSNSRNSSVNYGNSTSSPSSISSEESTQLGYNHFTKSTATSNTSNTSNTISTISTMDASSIVPTGLSTAACYQICTGCNQPPRPQAFNTATAAAACNMFFGNKATYMTSATPNVPNLLYTANTFTTNTNFLPNSLANASPALFHSNSMLPNTTQHYLNAFFKETQYLSNSPNVHGTTFYERLFYAQMLQQQIYHQKQQQAAAVAAMFQKQRPSAPALPLFGRNINTNTVNNPATTISGPTAKPNISVLSHSSRPKILPPITISPDTVLLRKHSKHIVPKSTKGNKNDDTNNGFRGCRTKPFGNFESNGRDTQEQVFYDSGVVSMDFLNNDPGAVQYGNFINYYQFSSAEEIIKLLPPKTIWESKECYTNNEPYLVLDVGCNSGELTKLLYQYLSKLMPAIEVKILGVDLDANLIQRAQLNTDKSKDSIVYECVNVMLPEDFGKIIQYLKKYQRERFDAVCCFSITMWIHLNYHDCGLQEFLKTFSSLGKVLIVEPQPWGCYQSAQRRMRKAKSAFPLFPELKWRTEIEQEIVNFVESVLNKKIIYKSEPTKWNRRIHCFR